MKDTATTNPKPFAVFDIDGTLIRWQLYHAVVDRLAKAGALGKGARETLREARMTWKRREGPESFRAYELTLIRLYKAALAQISTELFDELATEVIKEYRDQTYVYTRELIKKLKKEGYFLMVVSSSHEELISQIASYYGFDDWIAARYERKGANFTGVMEISTLDKEKPLKELITRNRLSTRRSIGIGDSNSDIAMLRLVEQPIAFNPEKTLYDIARKNGWKIVLERKNVIYELESKDGSYILAEADSRQTAVS